MPAATVTSPVSRSRTIPEWLGGVTIVRLTSESVGSEPFSKSLERTLATATPPSSLLTGAPISSLAIIVEAVTTIVITA